jgi:geranylgeranyl diphosphate synthase type II
MRLRRALAVLAGDALIVLAFQVLARRRRRPRACPLCPGRIMAQRVGMPCGIVAGQAWECEPGGLR